MKSQEEEEEEEEEEEYLQPIKKNVARMESSSNLVLEVMKSGWNMDALVENMVKRTAVVFPLRFFWPPWFAVT